MKKLAILLSMIFDISVLFANAKMIEPRIQDKCSYGTYNVSLDLCVAEPKIVCPKLINAEAYEIHRVT